MSAVLEQCLYTQPAFTCSKLTIETLKQRCEICSKITIKTPKWCQRCQWHCFGVFIVNFEHISHLCFSVSIVNPEHVIVGWVTITNNRGLKTWCQSVTEGVVYMDTWWINRIHCLNKPNYPFCDIQLWHCPPDDFPGQVVLVHA